MKSGGDDADLVVRTDDVWRSYVSAAETVHAVAGVTLDLAAGTTTCLMGPSGSGKSTLLNLIAGLDRPTSGEVSVLGVDLGPLDERDRARLRRESVGVVFQDGNLIDELDVADNIGLVLEARGWSRDAIADETEACLERVGLAGLSRRYPVELSGGQRQRVGVARAVAGGRRVLVADEPSGSLDRANALGIARVFSELAATGITCLVATHDPAISSTADRTIVLIDGGVAANGGLYA